MARTVRPGTERYHHNRAGEGKGDVRHKRRIMGCEAVVAVIGGTAGLGPRGQIF